MITTPLESKRALRREILARREAMSPSARATASVQIAQRALARIAEHQTIALYASIGTEVDTAPLDALLRARGTNRIVYPSIVPGQRALTFRAVDALADLVPTGKLQIREPIGKEIALDEIATFVMPGIAFDTSNHRVGWGRGHYDATLASIPSAVRIGLAFACQLVDQVPRESHDLAMTFVITETT